MFFMKKILPIMIALSAVTAAFAQERQSYSIMEPVLESFHSVCIQSGCYAIIAQGEVSQICLTVDHPDSLVMQSACQMEEEVLQLFPHPNISAQRPARLFVNGKLQQVLVEPGATLCVTSQSVCPAQIILYTDADGSSGQLSYEGDSSRYPDFAQAVSYRSFPEKRQWKFLYFSLNLETALSLFSNSHIYNNPYNIQFGYHLGGDLIVMIGAKYSRFNWFTGLYVDNAFFDISQYVEKPNNSNELISVIPTENVYRHQLYSLYLGVPIGFNCKIGNASRFSVAVTPSHCIRNVFISSSISQDNTIESSRVLVDLINPWRLDLQIGYHSSKLHLPEVGFKANLLPTFRKGLAEKPVHEFSIYFKF